jgi:hypothetical protein
MTIARHSSCRQFEKEKKIKKKKPALFVNLENMVLDKWNQWLKNLGPADN